MHQLRGRFPSPSSTLKPTRNANLATFLPNLDCFHHVLHSLDSLRKSSSLLSSLNSLPDILDSHLTVAVAGLEATATGLRLIIRITKTLIPTTPTTVEGPDFKSEENCLINPLFITDVHCSNSVPCPYTFRVLGVRILWSHPKLFGTASVVNL